jgi:hypothetical protein
MIVVVGYIVYIIMVTTVARSIRSGAFESDLDNVAW